MSLENLIDKLNINPDLEPSAENISPFIDGPKFFEGFLKIKYSYIFSVLKNKIYNKGGFIAKLPKKDQDFFGEFIRSKYNGSLEGICREVGDSQSISRILGTDQNLRAIAREVVKYHWMDSDIPSDYKIKQGAGNWYFDSEVVGEEKKQENLKKYIVANFNDLSEIKQRNSSIIASALGMDSRRASSIIKEIVNRGWISGDLPNDYKIKNGRNFYFMPEVVGEEKANRNIEEYVKANFNLLTDFNAINCRPIATALGINTADCKAVIQEVVKRGWLSPELPEDMTPRTGKGNWYFMPEVIGQKSVDLNVERYIRRENISLADFPSPHHLEAVCRILKVPVIRKELAIELVKHGWVNSEMPENYEISKNGNGDLIWDADVVGEIKANENLKKYIQRNFTDLRDFDKRSYRTVATAIGIGYSAKMSDFMAECIKRGFFSPAIPEDYELRVGANNDWYWDEKIVGKEWKEKNLETYVRSKVKDLSDFNFTVIKHLASALRLPEAITSIVVKDVIKRGWVSTEIPEDFQLKRGKSNLYFEDNIVGEEQKMKNLKLYLQRNFGSTNEINNLHTTLLSKVLGFDSCESVLNIRQKIEELGFLTGENIRESYASSRLPDSFKEKESKEKENNRKTTRRNLKTICETTERKDSKSIKFVKGEAFEQVFGIAISYLNPNEIIIPQYCLYVTDTKFSTRADFKVGNKIYEIKWGNSKINIEETFHKHRGLISKRNLDVEYELVRLEGETKIDVPTSLFDTYISKISEEDVRDGVVKLTRKLVELSRIDNESNEELIHQLRDYFYSTNIRANDLKDTERKVYIAGRINEAIDALNKENPKRILEEKTDKVFRNLEAFFEYNGRLYTGDITLTELQKEQSNRYRMLYHFGELSFEDRLDRDLAVMLECSRDGQRCNNYLDKRKKRFGSGAVFKMPDGTMYSTNGDPKAIHISDLEQLRGSVVEDQDFDFAKEYIVYHGTDC
jgi:hypothetical protein